MKRHAEKSDRQFWLWSALVHVILFALVLLSPAGQIFMKHETKLKPEIIRKGEELKEVVDDIRDLAVERLKEQVELLAAGQERMGTNFDTLNKHYQNFASQQKASAKDRLQDEMFTVHARIDGLLNAFKGAQKDPIGGIDAMNTAINENMARLLASQDEIRRSLQLMAPERLDLLALQTESMDLQQEANKFFRWTMHEAGVCQRYQKTIDSSKTSIPEAKTKLEAIQADIKRLDGEIAVAKKAEDTAAKAEKAASDSIKKLDGQIKKSKGSLGGLEKKLNGLKKAAEKDEAAIAAAQKAYDDAKAAIAALEAEKTAADAERKQQGKIKSDMANKAKSLSNEQNKAKRSERDLKSHHDRLVKSLADAEKALPDHVAKRDYCIRKSMELQSSVDSKLTTISEQFLAMLDGKGPTSAPAPDPEEAEAAIGPAPGQ